MHCMDQNDGLWREDSETSNECHGDEVAAFSIMRMDRIRYGDIPQCFAIVPIQFKIARTVVRWIGHVLCANENSAVKRALQLEVQGGRGQGGPCWMNTLHNGLKAVEVRADQAVDINEQRSHLCKRVLPRCETNEA